MLKSVGLRAGSLLQFRRFVRGTRFKVGQSCRSHLPSSGSSRSAGSATHHAQHDRAIDAARSGPPRVIRLTAATWADSCLRPAAPCITTQLPSAGTRPLLRSLITSLASYIPTQPLLLNYGLHAAGDSVHFLL